MYVFLLLASLSGHLRYLIIVKISNYSAGQNTFTTIMPIYFMKINIFSNQSG